MLPMAGGVRVLWHWFWLFSARTCSISYFFPAHQVCYYYDQGTIILISLHSSGKMVQDEKRTMKILDIWFQPRSQKFDVMSTDL